VRQRRRSRLVAVRLFTAATGGDERAIHLRFFVFDTAP
jgi:hypothetical protein